MLNKHQRSAERIKVNLEARWNGYFEQHQGNVCDLSTGGCFILTSGEVMGMELIEIEIELSANHWLRLWGQVAYHVADIGFGLCFTGLDDEKRDVITTFVAEAREHGALLAMSDSPCVSDAHPN